MARYAIIENGTVTNIIEADAEFAESIGGIPAGEGAIGDLYKGGKFSKPAAPTPDWPSIIAARRYEAEVSGTTVNDIPVDTGRDSQGLITGAAVQAIIDPEYSLHWKTTGGFVELTGQQILGVASMVRAHVQSCFNREAALLDAVAEGSITAEMLEEGWPV
ncbi:DUF4376 domain-containing protein [Pseudomonas sp. NIBR-H-19]|uniref:DUF4376 domain-containing protein n=1 Tax=Pseudomonas sp. NIBR-H-19 TaxID=2901380 RepID=UPI001E2E46FE|nr:DUF4376 domain-containing protein [Pseudomonas sp. NIBR-H-19]UHC81653.1 DUF4376 domain-containing protein [Pseudomonas sp. NIBR-H-19]UHC82253.1 DUF4376 domain-containing protein [Pseudomonas sp. NIBR-H-19]UHC82300.1 DUF4376 domain-containing protein [Pseudomonas sp. NIBR-H-19]